MLYYEEKLGVPEFTGSSVTKFNHVFRDKTCFDIVTSPTEQQEFISFKAYHIFIYIFSGFICLSCALLAWYKHLDKVQSTRMKQLYGSMKKEEEEI